jgi:hypothetical protein
MGGEGLSLWDESDGFFYDVLHLPDGSYNLLKIRSFVGLIPLFAVETSEPECLESLPHFRRRLEWFLKYRPQLIKNIASLTETGAYGQYQLAVIDRDKLERILVRVFNAEEFLSDYGLRALSKYHRDHPYEFLLGGELIKVKYEPAESSSDLFGGNSNWRGPIWFPLNYLLVDALIRFYNHYGDTFRVEIPYGSGNWNTLDEAANELCN